jgi:serine/threonine protein kinase
LIAGRKPFEGNSALELLPKVARGEFPRPRQLNPAIARALEAICLKAMSRQPADRYSTAEQLADDLQRYLADEPVGA